MELKFDQGFRVIGEYLSEIDTQYSQFESNILQLLGISDDLFCPDLF